MQDESNKEDMETLSFTALYLVRKYNIPNTFFVRIIILLSQIYSVS